MANDKNILDDLELYGDYSGEEGFSLESILAEYKGSAFMDGDKRTPSEELQRKTDDIIREALRDTARQEEPAEKPDKPAEKPEEPDIAAFFNSPELKRLAAEREPDMPEPEPEDPEMAEERPRRSLFRRKRDRREARPEPEEVGERREPAPRRRREVMDENAAPAYDTAPEIDLSVFDDPEDKRPERSVDDFISSLDDSDQVDNTYARDVEPGEDTGETLRRGEEELEADDARRRHGILGIFRKSRDGAAEETEEFTDDGDYSDEESAEEYDEDYYDIEPDPDFKKAAGVYARMVPSLRLRILGASVVAFLMVLTTWLFTAGHAMPLIGHTYKGNVAALLIMELIVIALGIDVAARGLEDILRLSPGVESLVFVSCAASVIDGFVMLITKNYSRGITLAVISAISLIGAMSARKSMYMALCDSLKGARASSSVWGVTLDAEDMEGRRVLKKIPGADEGFYAALTSPDKAEKLYDDLAPLLVIVSFVLSFLATVGHGNAGGFTHTFSVMTAVCAAFPAAVIFALPFKYAAASLRRSGGAVAGCAGAAAIAGSDGTLITDQDIFPSGSVTLEGVKVFEGVDPRRVISSAASLIITSDSGVKKVFEELLRSQSMVQKRVDEFSCYEGGGIGGLVEGERVLCGTGAFMNLMGLRVPDDLNLPGNVFAAINDEPVCVFSLSYVPSGLVQSALVALLGTRTNVLMAARDFNITPNSVRQKYKVSMDGVEYLPIKTAYDLSRSELPEGSGVSAILCRGGLSLFAEIISRAKQLKLITTLNSVVTGIGTALSVVIMFYLCWAGAFASAGALNIFFFMSVIGIAVYIMSQALRLRLK